MKPMAILALSWGLRLTAASTTPELQWDPNTISTCVEWFDNGGSDTCEYIRSMFAISAEEFHKWNPSVGTDCKPWRYQSYCILTEERLASLTSTTTEAPSTTTTESSSHPPSPTSWTALGCYIDDDPKFPVLETLASNSSKGLQIENCENKCWEFSTRWHILFAGVKQGNQCWCSSFVDGQKSKNQTDCNTPCTGNTKEMCGGENRINVFKPVTAESSVTTTKSTTTKSTTTTTATSSLTTTTKSSGAVRNRGVFWS
ncbi:hypothetical protein B0J13DRAFT_572100 [Dactylonectria estremocensis]|uniref:WSC domain-containing protein n=1 Tax=Dactylonectria estremocensis TaxID=1079267 RepID=A0A9P9DAK0_9HYPO|nr:hypothetical protein B0J13DRAFT_572100 [Dactylonectria estremocensis]